MHIFLLLFDGLDLVAVAFDRLHVNVKFVLIVVAAAHRRSGLVLVVLHTLAAPDDLLEACDDVLRGVRMERAFVNSTARVDGAEARDGCL